MQDIKAAIFVNELRAYITQKRTEQRALEERYNHNHDPKNGRFTTKQSAAKSVKAGTNKRHKSMSEKELNKSKKSLEKRIAEHENKIKSPESFYPDWNRFTEREKEGYKRHWKREIRAWKTQIKQIENEKARRKSNG